ARLSSRGKCTPTAQRAAPPPPPGGAVSGSPFSILCSLAAIPHIQPVEILPQLSAALFQLRLQLAALLLDVVQPRLLLVQRGEMTLVLLAALVHRPPVFA